MAPALPRPVSPPELAAFSEDELADMHDGAARVLEAAQALARSGLSVVSEVLRGQGDFTIWERYPLGDIFDTESHCHYFFHAHTPEEMLAGEAGHFHLFLRPAGLAPGLVPMDLPGAPVPAEEAARFIHIGAISVDAHGRALRLFTTNRWVTDETLYPAAEIAPLLARFRIGLAHPNWAVSEWLNGMVALFRPQIAAALVLRDAALRDLTKAHPATAVSEDRAAQNLSSFEIDIPAQIAAIEAALGF